MKIISDVSFPKSQKPDPANRNRTRDGTREAGSGTFAETLQKAAGATPEPVRAGSMDAVQVISLENRRAQSPPKDLSAAEELLQSVQAGLAGMTRAELGRVHRLEGLVHVFQV